MKLVAFRVQNYKKIQDTGWISVRDLTCFVGKNEAGKSALFRGLSKLNPSDGEKYDGLKEFPRRRYTDEFKNQDWPVASGKFELDDTDREQLRDICPHLADTTHVICTRHYSWKLSVKFEPGPSVIPTRAKFRANTEDLRERIKSMKVPEGNIDALDNLDNMMQALYAIPQLLNAKSPKDISKAKHPLERALFPYKLRQAEEWVEENLPKFIYFDRYDVIESAVHLPSFVRQLNQNPSDPRVRTTRCLFEYVGLDTEYLASLGRHQPGENPDEKIRRYVDERAIHFSRASSNITAKFQDWWEQRRHKFRYQADGDYFRIWVSDDLDPSEIELDQRSLGMQYFFSFFTVFLVEAQGAHQKAILLLDEPGLHMHGTAQAKIVKFLEKLSQENQTMYTTHSPFMVDADHLERVRVVYEAKDGTTKVSEDVWPRDKDALFPLQAALGYQLVQSLFIGKRQLIVEGITDYWILKAFDQALRRRGKPSLRDDVVIVPSAGVNKVLPLASILSGHNVEVVALLDGDKPGRREGKKLAENLFMGETGRCLFVSDFVEGKMHAELEDIFPEEVYLQAVKEAYKIADLAFGEQERAIESVAKKVRALFKRKGLDQFKKWRPAGVLRDWIMETPEKIPDAVYDTVSRIFEAVNNAFNRSIDGNEG